MNPFKTIIMIKETIESTTFEIIKNNELLLVASAKKEDVVIRAEYNKSECKENNIDTSEIQLLNYQDKHILFGLDLKKVLINGLEKSTMISSCKKTPLLIQGFYFGRVIVHLFKGFR